MTAVADRPPTRVLVVDDEEHITELVSMGLTYNGFEVERVGSCLLYTSPSPRDS